MKINKETLSYIIKEELTALLAEAGDKYTTYSHNVGDSSGRAVQTRGMHPPKDDYPPPSPEKEVPITHKYPAIARFYPNSGIDWANGWRPDLMPWSVHHDAGRQLWEEFYEAIEKPYWTYDKLIEKYFTEMQHIVAAMVVVAPHRYPGSDLKEKMTAQTKKYFDVMFTKIEHKKEQK